MSRRRFWWLLAAAIVVLAGALYLSGQRERARQAPGAALFPSLGAALPGVSAVTVRKGAAAPAATLHKTGAIWTVAERADYPADMGKLRKLLTDLGEAKIVEEKTADAASYPVIGVADPAAAGSLSTEVTVAAPPRQFAVIVGKTAGAGSFVRRAGEPQSYSVEPAITVDAEPQSWIDARLLKIPTTSIQRIEVKPDTGPGYVVKRSHAPDGDFELEGTPARRKALDGPALAPSRTLLDDLDAEDVAPAATLDFSHASQAIVVLNDGTSVTLTGTVIAGKHWVQLTSSKDAALTAKTAGRAFELPTYRYDPIFKPLDQLLVPLPAPAQSKSAPVRPTPATP